MLTVPLWQCRSPGPASLHTAQVNDLDERAAAERVRCWLDKMKVCLHNVGCRLNWSEIEGLARRFTAAGHAIVSEPEQAELIVVNTCAVTAQAERKTRHEIRSLARANPEARIAVIGCYATLRPEKCANFPGVICVVPNDEKERTVEMVAPYLREGVGEEQGGLLRTRAFVKVQDGCDNHCTYCIVRSLRGASRSRPVKDIVAEIQGLVAEADCQEAVLTGASLGAYGRDLGLEGGLRTLVEALLTHTDLARLRLSSLEPWDVDESFFELWEDTRLCRQLHLPLQAGHDETLRRMGRPITTARFAQLTGAARSAIPDLAVTTDVLLGFPGESEAAFRASRDFVQRMAFAKLHVFPYSPRPGTSATKLPNPVPRDVRDERARKMRELGAEQARRFYRQFVGREMEVLWEHRWRDGRWTGWTDNYIRVVAYSERDLKNRITAARLLTMQDGYLEGKVIE